MNFSIGKKLMGLAAFLLLVTVIIWGSSTINLKGVIKSFENTGEKLNQNTFLVEKEVDHLIWSDRVKTAIYENNINHLDVEINDHKCGLGKWLYGDARKQSEKMIPSLAPLFQKLEAPHRELHLSAGQMLANESTSIKDLKKIYTKKKKFG